MQHITLFLLGALGVYLILTSENESADKVIGFLFLFFASTKYDISTIKDAVDNIANKL